MILLHDASAPALSCSLLSLPSCSAWQSRRHPEGIEARKTAATGSLLTSGNATHDVCLVSCRVGGETLIKFLWCKRHLRILAAADGRQEITSACMLLSY